MSTEFIAALPTPDELADKVRDYLREIHGTLGNAGFMLELLKPISSDMDIIRPLDGTEAANALNALQWGLYCLAAMDACKVLDGNPRSVSLVEVVRLLQLPAVVDRMRSRVTTPLSTANSFSSRVPPDIAAALVKEDNERHASENGQRFDESLTEGMGLYATLLAAQPVKRLRDARNKIIAHGNAYWDSDTKSFRVVSPEDYKLLWGDAESAVSASVKLTELWLIGLCAEGYFADEARGIFKGYSEEFWGHLKAGLMINGGVPDKPIRREQ